MRFVRTRLLLGVLTVSACGPPNPNPDGGLLPDGGEVAALLELGNTDESGAFVPFSTDAFAIPGSQGGFHINVMYKLPEGGVGPMTFEHRVVRASDGKLVSTGSRQWDLGLFRVSSWASPAPVNVFMCPTPVGVDVIGREMLFTVKAKDASGRVVAIGTARAAFRCGENAGAFCSTICKG
jgi:hypothetical protein